MKHFVLSATLGLSLLGLTGVVAADEAADAAQLELGKTLFIKDAVPACAICHALKDAGATGAIGPDLDELKPSFSNVVTTVQTGVGVMPSFAATLTEDQINAVAAYVASVTGGGQ